MVAPPRRVFLASLAGPRPIPQKRRTGVPTQPPGTAYSKVTAVYSSGQFDGTPNARDRVWDPEQMAASLVDLGRDDLKKRIKDFRGRFKLDFSDAYLDALTVERLRHLLLAALINARAEP